MRPLTIPGAAEVIPDLVERVTRSEEARYEHRLHAILLVARGLTCPEVARLLGDPPRTVQHWVSRFIDEGLEGLDEDERPGRPSRLTRAQLRDVRRALSRHEHTGRSLSAYIEERFGIRLGVRQCQRLIRSMRKNI
jgi:transposase